MREARAKVHEQLVKRGTNDMAWLEGVVDCEATHNGEKVGGKREGTEDGR